MLKLSKAALLMDILIDLNEKQQSLAAIESGEAGCIMFDDVPGRIAFSALGTAAANELTATLQGEIKELLAKAADYGVEVQLDAVAEEGDYADINRLFGGDDDDDEDEK